MNLLFRFFLLPKQYPLSYRLVGYVVLCSSFFALLATATQLYVDFQKDSSAVYDSFEFIETSYLDTISTSVFKIDTEQLQHELAGALQLPGVVYVEIQEPRGDRIVTFTRGNPEARRTVKREFPLEYASPSGEIRPVGDLKVVASLEGVYERLWSRVLIILGTNTLKVFLASSCILAIVYLLLTRHLTQIANYTRDLEPGTPGRLLRLNRRSPGPDAPDEIEHVVLSINDLQEKSAQAIAKREQAETEIRERLRFEEMLSEVSARFVNLVPGQVNQEFERALEWIGEILDVDRVTVFEISEKKDLLRATHLHARPDSELSPSQIELHRMTWAAQKLLAGETLVLSHPEDLPEEAEEEREYFLDAGVQSAVVIPIQAGGSTLGALTLATLTRRTEWPDDLLRRFGLIAEVFGNALVRHRVEGKLREAERKYRTVADLAYDWETWAHLDGTLEYVSPSCERISGHPAHDFLRNPSLLRELIVPEDRELWDEHYRASRAEPGPQEISFRIRKRDGQIRWIEHACQPVTDDHGHVSGFRASNRDITARKQGEEALRQSKDFNRSVLRSLEDHIAVLDHGGNILYVNEAWLRFARENDGKSANRVGSGANYLDISRESADAGDETAGAGLEGIRSVFDGSRQRFELEYPCDSPTEKRWFLMTVILYQGRKGGVIVAHKNITARKQAEVELRRAYTQIEQLSQQLEAESSYLQEEIKLEHNFENIIGNSDALKYVLYRLGKVASTDSTVLVLGETGTGKELVARALHDRSPRKQRPLVKVNCATLPAHLIESELFGHEKGAFTGAAARKLGRFELANGSTLFLDEIGTLPLELQPKLLRAIEDGELERLGGSETIQVDVRVIAATNRDLEQETRVGRFREDLWYRLNVYPLTLPPLRERAEDIPLLVQHFVEQANRRFGKNVDKIPPGFVERMKSHPWSGNVRELKHVIERAVINAAGTSLKLTEELGTSLDTSATAANGNHTLAEMERAHILDVLEKTTWRIEGSNGAAEILDINPGTLRSRMKKLGIQRPNHRA
jgi:PAS domain S-box-containing protein